MIKQKNCILAIFMIALISQVAACSPSSSEPPAQSGRPIQQAVPNGSSDMDARGQAAQQAASIASSSSSSAGDKPLDLSPGKLPGADAAQPGLMPGHVVDSNK